VYEVPTWPSSFHPIEESEKEYWNLQAPTPCSMKTTDHVSHLANMCSMIVNQRTAAVTIELSRKLLVKVIVLFAALQGPKLRCLDAITWGLEVEHVGS
jgi:hypothetical protein